MMEELRTKLHEYIMKYGTRDWRTVEVSKQLDILIVEEQKIWA